MRVGRKVLIGEVEFNLGNVSILVSSSTREVLTCLRMASPSGWSLLIVIAGLAVTVSFSSSVLAISWMGSDAAASTSEAAMLIRCVDVVRDCAGVVESLSVLSKTEAEWENHDEPKQVC
jgi:hypothetical protein